MQRDADWRRQKQLVNEFLRHAICNLGNVDVAYAVHKHAYDVTQLTHLDFQPKLCEPEPIGSSHHLEIRLGDEDNAALNIALARCQTTAQLLPCSL